MQYSLGQAEIRQIQNNVGCLTEPILTYLQTLYSASASILFSCLLVCIRLGNTMLVSCQSEPLSE